MPTRDDIKAALRRQLEALKAARIEEIKADQPQMLIHNEPVNYDRIALLLAKVVDRFVGEYAPLEHRHRWQEIDSKPTTYPPGRHTHQDMVAQLDDMSASLGSLRSYTDDISRHVEDIATAPVVWDDIEGKPTTYPPGRHTHEQDGDLVALLRLFDKGKPGDVLTRVRDGIDWKPVPINAFYYPGGGGGGGGGGWLPNKSSGLPGPALPSGYHYITMELEFDTEIEFQGDMLYVE